MLGLSQSIMLPARVNPVVRHPAKRRVGLGIEEQRRKYNLISSTVEMALPVDLHISAVQPGEELLNVVKEPFGKASADGRFSRQSRQIGYYFGACPAVLYIAGPDDAGTKAAAYDLIHRIWGVQIGHVRYKDQRNE